MAFHWSTGLIAWLSISGLLLQAGSQGTSSAVPEINSSVRNQCPQISAGVTHTQPYLQEHVLPGGQHIVLCADLAGGTWGYRHHIRHIEMHADGADSCRLQTDPAYVYTHTVRRFLDIHPPSQLMLPWHLSNVDCCANAYRHQQYGMSC